MTSRMPGRASAASSSSACSRSRLDSGRSRASRFVIILSPSGCRTIVWRLETAVSRRRIVTLSRSGQRLGNETAGHAAWVRIVRPPVPGAHIERARSAAVRSAKRQGRTPRSTRRIDVGLSVRRGIRFEAERRNPVHGPGQPARVRQRCIRLRRKLLLPPFGRRFAARLIRGEPSRRHDRRRASRHRQAGSA